MEGHCHPAVRHRGCGYVSRHRFADLAEKVVSLRYHDYVLCGPYLLLDVQDNDIVDITAITVVITVTVIIKVDHQYDDDW